MSTFAFPLLSSHLAMEAFLQTRPHRNTICFGALGMTLNSFWLRNNRFTAWKCAKSRLHGGLSGTYLSREYYVCARHGTGGTKSYAKKHDDWSRKIPSKITHCTASLVIKSYPDKQYLLGIYDSEHNHPLGYQNIRFTRISPSTRDWIAGMVRMKVKTNHIVSNDVISISSHELTCISTS